MPLPIYVHIPFCQHKCQYCDFVSFAGKGSLIEPYVNALAREIVGAGWLLSQPVERRAGSIYIGGGTPSLLSADQVHRILNAISGAFPLLQAAEVTIEANPGTVGLDWLRAVRQAGVTRLSLGVQALDDETLRALGRIHTAAEAIQAVQMARLAGFVEVSLDLMYGLPGQLLADWLATLRAAIALGAGHLSLYALTVEEETPLGRDIRAGRAAPPDDDLMAAMYEAAEDALAAAGFRHYEISNWAMPGHECRHNLAYWRNQPYLGFGAGAHSSCAREMLSNPAAGPLGAASPADPACAWVRWRNGSDPGEYVATIAEGRPVSSDRECLTREQSMWETAFLALRMVEEGLEIDGFSARFGMSCAEAFGAGLSELAAAGLIVADDERIRLTRRGRLLSNEVFVRLAPARG